MASLSLNQYEPPTKTRPMAMPIAAPPVPPMAPPTMIIRPPMAARIAAVLMLFFMDGSGGVRE